MSSKKTKRQQTIAASRKPEEQRGRRSIQKAKRIGLEPKQVRRFLDEELDFDLHVKTVLSLAMATTGVLYSMALAIHMIGRAMAWAMSKDAKHTVKQVDRLLSNAHVQPWDMADAWVRYVVGQRREVLVALDWTVFQHDKQSTLALHLVDRHGRTMPLLWKTVAHGQLRGHQTELEDQMVEKLDSLLDEQVTVTLLADRGFASAERLEMLEMLGWHYVIRFTGSTIIIDQRGRRARATEWLSASGRARKLSGVRWSNQQVPVGCVVVTKPAGQREPWCLVSSHDELTASQLVKLYARRFRIEETFRDIKDIHFGLGLSATHISQPLRRDRLLLIAAFAQVLLTMLGEAGERVGLDRYLKTNTSSKRQLSLLHQGQFWFLALPRMPDDRLELLMGAFADILQQHQITRELLGFS